MRIPRSRGAVSGLLLMVLGAWGALIPAIGPYFSVEVGSDQTWKWSTGDLWLSVLPGVVAFLGGLWLLRSAHRANAGLGAWMAVLAGAWFIVGPTVSTLWNDGVSAGGEPAGSDERQVVELLVTYYALGALIVAIGAFALGRLAVRSVRDVELARELEGDRETPTMTPRRAPDERFDREPTRARPAAADEQATAVTPREHAAPRSSSTQTQAQAQAQQRSGGLIGRFRRS
jgi:hypothetical protein